MTTEPLPPRTSKRPSALLRSVAAGAVTSAGGSVGDSTPEGRYAAVRDSLLVEFGASWVMRKPWLLSLHKAAMAVAFLAGGYDRTRFVALVAVWLAGLAFDVFEARALRRGPRTDRRIVVDTAVSMCLLACTVALTGGLTSPLLPSMMVGAVIPAAAFGRRLPTFALFGELVVLMVLLACLPASVTGPPLASPWDAIAMAYSFVFAAFISVSRLIDLTEVYSSAAMLAARMRDEALALHEARARSIETMGAKVAHEIKNPLAAIAGLVQLLQRGAHDAKTSERLQVVASEVGRIERVLKDYLAFSRPLDRVEPVSTELAELVDDVVALLDARAEKRDVALVREGEGTADVDPHRLKEALVNVVGNAIEASPPGSGVALRIAVEAGQARVDVVDEGPGIPAGVLARVGTPYFTTKPDGTGLGVVLAKAVLAQHGGALELVSTEGKGTTARLTWPAVRVVIRDASPTTTADVAVPRASPDPAAPAHRSPA